MSRPKAFVKAKKTFPGLKPTRPACFTMTDDCKSVLISCYDEPVCLVVDGETDLWRLRSIINMALGEPPVRGKKT